MSASSEHLLAVIAAQAIDLHDITETLEHTEAALAETMRSNLGLISRLEKEGQAAAEAERKELGNRVLGNQVIALDKRLQAAIELGRDFRAERDLALAQVELAQRDADEAELARAGRAEALFASDHELAKARKKLAEATK